MRVAASFLIISFAAFPGNAAGPSSFGFVAAPQPVNLPGTSAAIADFNNDGNPDIISVYASLSQVNICFGDGQGGFSAPVPVPAATGAYTASVADLNGDGNLDLAIHVFNQTVSVNGSIAATESVQILLGDGKGGFRIAGSFSIPVTGGVGEAVQGYGRVNSIVIADFNGDGKPDLAITDAPAQTVDIWLGNGDGTFQTGVGYSTGPNTTIYLAVGDVNGDGVPDIVAGTAISALVLFPGLEILLGNGDGTFQAPSPAPADSGAESGIYNVVAADVNGDGKLDLVTANDPGVLGNDCVSVYLGRGNGTFATPVDYPCIQYTNPFPGGLVVVDVTGDGILDILIGNGGNSGDLQLYPGNGDGTFQSGAFYSLTTAPNTIAAGDVNGDGRVDLVVGAQDSINVVVLDGVAAPFLRGVITNNTQLYYSEPGGEFSAVVSNVAGAAPTQGEITVSIGPTGSDLIGGVSGQGWDCGLNVGGIGQYGCTRTDSLPPGESFPAVEVQIIPAGYPVGIGERVTISGGGSASTLLSEVFQTLPYSVTCEYTLHSPATVTVGAGGEALLFDVLTAGGTCPYSETSNVPWISNGTVAPNQSGALRTGEIQFSSASGWSASITVNQLASGCTYELDRTYVVVPAMISPENVIPFNVITSPGCVWTSSTTANWIGLGAASSATGVPSPYLTAMSNPGSGYRFATVTVAGLTLNVFQDGSTTPSSNSAFSHWAVGGGWDTTIQLVNASSSLAQVTGLGINGDGGSTMLLNNPPSPFEGVGGFAGFGFFLPAYSLHELDASGEGTVLTQTGDLIVYGDSTITGLLRFRYDPTGQEGIVPLERRNAGFYVLAFDNTNGIATGVAVANLSNTSATIRVTIRDDTGAVIGTGTVSLGSYAHSAFVLSNQFSSSANATGTIEFDTPSGGRISVIGIRYPPSGQFTTIPVAASTDPANGSIAQFTTGGGWTTTVELMNTGSAPANAQLAFYGDSGSPLALPLSVGGVSRSSATLNESLPAHSRIVIETTNASSATAQNGSARLTSTGQVSGFLRYLYGPSGEEAISPLETRNAGSYLFPFDNTNGLATGAAVANLSASAANVGVVIRDVNGNQLGTGTLTLAGNGHVAAVLATQFPVTTNQSGTIEFDAPAGGGISVLGIRFPSASTFTTIPVAAE